MSGLRLQVFLSRSGACSRRKALEIVFSGRVTVNGRCVREPSFSVDPQVDRVCLDATPLGAAPPVYIVLHKPKGVVTTKSDRFAEKTVLDLLPEDLRHLNPVGRLDKDTTGLLLLTNDGDAAYRLTHPSVGVDKVYRVRLDKRLDDDDRKRLEAGVFLDGKKTRPCRMRLRGADVEVTLHEGRKRQVRRMFALLGYGVEELARLRHGPLTLGALAPGRWRRLTSREVRGLAFLGGEDAPLRRPKV
jgi:pseudouridine synthase